MNERFPQLFWGLVALTIGLFAVGFFTYAAIRAAKRGNDVITVTGSARRTVRSDYATWSGNFGDNNMSLTEGYKKVLANQEQVRAYLRSRHIADSLVTFSGVNTRDMFSRKRRDSGETAEEFIGYNLSQRVEVKGAQVDSIEAIARDITSLTAIGLLVNSEAPQYFYSKLADLRIEMLAEATKDARLRASQIAESAGGRIGGVRNARMGVFQITAPNSREVSDYGVYNTATIDKDITAVVSASFAVE